MRVVVVRIVSGERKLLGYLRRYLFEVEAGVLLGSVTAPLEREILNCMEDAVATGYMIVSCRKSATGYRIPYFSMRHSRAIELDGVWLVEKLRKSAR